MSDTPPSGATIFFPAESRAGETRVAAAPDTVKRFAKAGLTCLVERGAGAPAHIPDERLVEVGAQLADASAWGTADLVAKVQPPTPEEARRLKRGAYLVSHVYALANADVLEALRESGATTFAMELVPRISRAQSMDALSSQATISGYKAVLLGAAHMPVLCPLLMTAAGTVRPAKALVFGAGVAGLQAIATARRLGCQVEATDVRLAAKEQVESLGARFVDVPGMEDMEDEGGYAKEATEDFLRRQREEVAKRLAEADLAVTTALIPGRPAPRLISEEMVRSMKPGAVIVDLAVETGGNCELSVRGEVVERHGVTIVGTENLPATVPLHASELYAKNVFNLVKPMIDDGGRLAPDWEDEVFAGCVLVKDGEVVHERTREALGAGAGA
jgi:NAD(P) transhydrogenase subunit alpha